MQALKGIVVLQFKKLFPIFREAPVEGGLK